MYEICSQIYRTLLSAEMGCYLFLLSVHMHALLTGASTKGPVPRKVEPAVSAATAPQTTSAGKTTPVTSLTGLRPLTVQNTHDKQVLAI